MPRGDRTGPLGLGPGTGRALGYCYGYDTPGFTKGPGLGRGAGFRFGRGMGWGRGFGRAWGFAAPYPGYYTPGYPWMSSMSKEDEVKLLKSQADELSRAQKEIEKRLGELENTE